MLFIKMGNEKLLFVGFLLVTLSSVNILAQKESNSKAENLFFVVSARDLPARDTNQQVDPFVKVFLGRFVNNNTEDLRLIGRSETLTDDVNPDWQTVFKVAWNKGKNQVLVFKMRDHDPLDLDDEIDEVMVDIDEYVENGQSIEVPLSTGGSLMMNKTEPIHFYLEVRNVPRLDEFNGLSDPFVECYYRGTGKNMKFYTTPVINNVENAKWDTPIPFDNYQPGTDESLHFIVYDHDSITQHDSIGDAFLSVATFRKGDQRTFVLPLGHGKNNATLLVKRDP